MKAALIAFDHMTALDFIGFYDPLTRLKSMNLVPALEWRICARRPQVSDDRGLTLVADAVDGTLADFDVLFVPGGFGTRALQHDRAFVEWIATARPVKLKISVCTGALLLGAAASCRDDGRRRTPARSRSSSPTARRWCASE